MSLLDGDDGRGVSRHLGLTMRESGTDDELVVEGRAEVGIQLRGPGGSLRGGALLTMFDSVGGLCSGLAALPDGWVVSTNLMLRTARLAPVGPVTVTARVVRVGRHAIVAEVAANDDGDRGAPLADGTLTSAVLVPDAGPPIWERPVVLESGGVPPGPPSLLDRFGIRGHRDGSVSVEATPAVRNPWGIVHGGVTATLVDAAAERAVSSRVAGPVAAADVVLHFLAPGRAGPLRATGEVLGERADGYVVRVEVVDDGADGRCVALAVTTVREVP